MSNFYKKNEYQCVVDSNSYIIGRDYLSQKGAHDLYWQEQNNRKWYLVQRVPPMNKLAYSETSQSLYKPYGSCPNNYLSSFPVSNQHSIELTSSDCFSEQDSSQDTVSFANSNDETENELEDEIKSRLEADDELASIFGSDETCVSNSSLTRTVGIQRPHNPIVYDRNFNFPRCSAPSIEKQSMASQIYNKKPLGNNYNSHFE